MNVKKDNTSNKYYSVVQNPAVDYYDRKVIYGGTPEIVERKVNTQLKKWWKDDFETFWKYADSLDCTKKQAWKDYLETLFQDKYITKKQFEEWRGE